MNFRQRIQAGTERDEEEANQLPAAKVDQPEGAGHGPQRDGRLRQLQLRRSAAHGRQHPWKRLHGSVRG